MSYRMFYRRMCAVQSVLPICFCQVAILVLAGLFRLTRDQLMLAL